MLEMQQLIILGLGSLVIGYGIFLFSVFLLPRKLRSQNSLQRSLLLAEAKQKAEVVKGQEIQRLEAKMTLALEELDSEVEEKKITLNAMDEDLNARQDFVQHEEKRLEKLNQDIEGLRSKITAAEQKYKEVHDQRAAVERELQEKLAAKIGKSLDQQKESLLNDVVQKRQLECTKYLKVLADELDTSAARMGNRILSRAHARYTPQFVWPKGLNHVELKDRRTADMVMANPALIENLTQLTEGVTITLSEEKDSDRIPIIRLGGGFGIYKEAAKLALEEIIPRGPNGFGKIADVYSKHRTVLERKALDLGKQALLELNLTGVHVEILKMVGSLNWRTSYRQNQFYHSIEVAKLAGIIAAELGVDPDSAKRCGLLHDIGKSIDYRIEGSHAVISGDYADRFGERKLICDTVMSHHADLLVETPLAYVLRSADTLSGARPGARVNLEEGYQDRLSSIQDVVRAFPGVIKVEIMNGAREVHVEVNHKRVKENELESLSQAIARRIETEVAYPGQIKILVARRFESVAVA